MLFREENSDKCISCPVLLQAANASQQKLESELSIFLSMVKNEENCGKSFGVGHISMLLIQC